MQNDCSGLKQGVLLGHLLLKYNFAQSLAQLLTQTMNYYFTIYSGNYVSFILESERKLSID